jgi:beta-mannosidase
LFGQLPDLETTVRCSQFVQAEGLRYANQSMRRNQWHRSAFTSWTLNEPWPNAAHGCLVEYYGKPKMAYYYAKNTCFPVDVSCVYSNLYCNQEQPLTIEVWVSNNNINKMLNHKLRWRIFNTHGQTCYEGKEIINIDSEKSEIVDKIMWRPSPGMEGDVALLYVELLDLNEKVIAENLYTFGIQKSKSETSAKNTSPPLLKALLHATSTNLKVQAINFHNMGKGNTEGVIEVENVGNNVGLFVELNVDSTSEIRAYFTDNYFFLPLGQKRQIKVNLLSEKSNQNLSSIKLSAKAWNSYLKTLDVPVN